MRVIGTIMSFLTKINTEKINDTEGFASKIMPVPVKKIYCRWMRLHVNICKVNECKYYKVCVPKHECT